MEITSGDFKVLYAGSVYSFKEESILFNLHEELQIRLVFKNDPSKANGYHEYVPVNETCLQITMVNYNNVFGSGFPEPVKIGNIGPKDVYMIFWVYRVYDFQKNKKIDYTFYTN